MNFSQIIKIEFKKLAVLTTFVEWRKSKFMSFVWSLIAPVEDANRRFLKFRTKSIYKVVHNGTVILLTKVMNDLFDPEERRIYITDSLSITPLRIYTKAETRPLYIGKKYIRQQFEQGDLGTDFYVIFPLALKPAVEVDIYNLENRIKSELNYYKLATKKYKILWID